MDDESPVENDLVGGPVASSDAEDFGDDRLARLSSGQLEVLRLVNQHLNSKEIGARLGISSHTVDQRVRSAIKRLGVTRRSEAARLVALLDADHAPALPVPPLADPALCERLIYQSPHIDAGSDRPETDVAVSFQIRHADRTREGGAWRLETEQGTSAPRPSLLPWSTPQQPSNDWDVGRRLGAIVGIAIGASFSAGMLLAGLESLSRLVRP